LELRLHANSHSDAESDAKWQLAVAARKCGIVLGEDLVARADRHLRGAPVGSDRPYPPAQLGRYSADDVRCDANISQLVEQVVDASLRDVQLRRI
jgi:hypothetical protein